MTLVTETAPARDKVPMQYIGQARQLRRQIHHSAKEAVAAQKELLAPLQPTQGRVIMPRHAWLKQLARKWQRLPAFGRLNVVAKFKDGRLQIAELRLIPSTITIDGWESDEPAVAVGLTVITCRPPQFSERRIILGVVGQHALARRFHRADPAIPAVLADMLPLARDSFGVVAHGGEFAIECPSGGRWIGAFDPRRHAGLLVRTFV